jgi:secreted trypsin-like serine protease
MKKTNYIALMLLLASCGPNVSVGPQDIKNPSTNFSIVGGEDVTNEIFAKHIVAIHNDQRGYWCTGSLIGRNTVVTAAHCFMDDPSAHTIYFSKSVIQFDNAQSKVTAYKIHPQYNATAWTNRNDLAIATFSGSYPTGYEPINFPSTDDLANIGGEFFATGFGSTTARRDIQNDGAGVLRYTRIKLDTQVLTPAQNQFTVDQTNGHGVCFGDSGGPAFIKRGDQRIIIGVASAVYSNDEEAKKHPDYDVCRYNGIYISVYPYKDWIQKTSAELSPR